MLYCSFFGKIHHQVRELIAGPGVHICNECYYRHLSIAYSNACACAQI